MHHGVADDKVRFRLLL